jgi:drug/metabolite transporter (DMT)-like permease
VRASTSNRHATRQRALGLFAVVIAAISWGFTGIFVDKAASEPITLTFYRMWIAAALIYSASVLARRRLTWAAIRTAAPAGIFLCADITLTFYAFRLTSVAIASIVGALTPALVLLLSRRVLGETAGWHDALLIAIATAAVAIVVIGPAQSAGNHLTGDMCAALGTLAFVGYWLSAKRVRITVDSLQYTSAVWLIAAVAITPVTLISGAPLRLMAPADWIWVTLLVLVPGGGHVLLIWAHKVVKASVSAMIGQGNILVAAITASVFLHQRMTWSEVGGGLLAVIATGVIAVREARRAPLPETAGTVAEVPAPLLAMSGFRSAAEEDDVKVAESVRITGQADGGDLSAGYREREDHSWPATGRPYGCWDALDQCEPGGLRPPGEEASHRFRASGLS